MESLSMLTSALVAVALIRRLTWLCSRRRLVGWLPCFFLAGKHQKHGRRTVEQGKHPFSQCCFHCPYTFQRNDRYDANKLNVLLCYVICGAKLSAADFACMSLVTHVGGHGSTLIWTWKWRRVFECCRSFVDANVKALLMENEKVLKLIQSELLQTEIRVLYELLYILNNSYRGNKTFKSLKQVRALDATSFSILLNQKWTVSMSSKLRGAYFSHRLNNV